MTEIEKTEGEIKLLQAKLELLKRMENPTPVEEAYKRFFGRYPNSGDCWTDDNEEFWYFFQVGYKSAKEDCKVGEEVEEDEWKLVALRFGEKLSDTGPGGYYDFTPGEWMEWALNAYEQGTCKVEEPKPMDDVIDRLVEKYKSQKLWNMMRNELGYSIDCCDEIVDLVEKWLPKEQSAEGSQNSFAIDATEGFNHCLNKIKGTLR